MLVEAPAVVSILEDWKDRAEREEEIRQIQSAIPTFAMDVADKDCVIPAMPVILEQEGSKHRPKLRNHSPFQDAMVARSVGRKEMLSNKDALKASIRSG